MKRQREKCWFVLLHKKDVPEDIVRFKRGKGKLG